MRTSQVASAARDAGAGIATSACVSEVLTDASGTRATGVRLLSGEVVTARKAVVANCTPFHLFAELMAGSPAVPAWLDRHVRHADYSCGCVASRRRKKEEGTLRARAVTSPNSQ